MKRLFARLYLDEDVDVTIAPMVRARGFGVTTTRQAERLGTTDADQLAYASAEQLVLVTHNRRDFEKLVVEYEFATRNHAGVIIAVRRPPAEIVRRLLVVLNHVTADEMANQVRYI